MFEESNKMMLESLATQLANGNINVEEASKLLNTLARFEERTVNNITAAQTQSSTSD